METVKKSKKKKKKKKKKKWDQIDMVMKTSYAEILYLYLEIYKKSYKKSCMYRERSACTLAQSKRKHSRFDYIFLKE